MTTNSDVRGDDELLPTQEVLANIERGQLLMREPAGLDLNAIVKRSVEAYWSEYDKQALEGELDPALNWLAVRRLTTWGSFLKDLGAGPAITTVLVIGAIGWYGLATTSSALKLFVEDARFWPAVAALVIVCTVAAWMYRNDRATEYIGAIAACTFAAVFIGGFSHSVSLIETATALAKTQLEQSALSLMATHEETGRFEHLSVTGSHFTLSTGNTSKEQGVYYATAPGLSGRMVATVGPSSGTVTWTGSSGGSVTNLFTGEVLKADGNLLEIKDASGQTVTLKRAASSPLLSLQAGNFVMGAYDNKTKETSVLITRPRPGRN